MRASHEPAIINRDQVGRLHFRNQWPSQPTLDADVDGRTGSTVARVRMSVCVFDATKRTAGRFVHAEAQVERTDVGAPVGRGPFHWRGRLRRQSDQGRLFVIGMGPNQYLQQRPQGSRRLFAGRAVEEHRPVSVEMWAPTRAIIEPAFFSGHAANTLPRTRSIIEAGSRSSRLEAPTKVDFRGESVHYFNHGDHDPPLAATAVLTGQTHLPHANEERYTFHEFKLADRQRQGSLRNSMVNTLSHASSSWRSTNGGGRRAASTPTSSSPSIAGRR